MFTSDIPRIYLVCNFLLAISFIFVLYYSRNWSGILLDLGVISTHFLYVPFNTAKLLKWQVKFNAHQFINFDGDVASCRFGVVVILHVAFVLICTFYEDNTEHGTGILFVIRGDTFNKVWKCILWNIHIWRSVAGCHGYKRVMYDFPHRSLQQYFRMARKPAFVPFTTPWRCARHSCVPL